MADEREQAPFPREDARETGMGDQMPEENPDATTPREGSEGQGPESGAGGTDAPDTSRERGPESDPGRATVNPDAAG
jgi:hypothetical protein